VASLHASWTQWKNIFSFEVFGERGGVVVDGLGGSYGPERLTIYHRAEAGAPREETEEYPGPDTSWVAEWDDFMTAIRTGVPSPAAAEDGVRALQLVEDVYAMSGRSVTR